MRERVLHEVGGSFVHGEGGSFVEGMLGDTEPVFDQTPEVRLHPSTDSTDTDEDDVPLRWALQRRMVPITTKGKEKVTKETPKKSPFTRAISQKLMGDAMKFSETTTAENRRRRRYGVTHRPQQPCTLESTWSLFNHVISPFVRGRPSTE
ncbi:hypothetical protein KY284_010733 [Solanum tuberosum]|nr:hypothetical protein KY284_010733 [Solanum tuberosum]